MSPQAPIRQIIKQSNLHPVHDIRLATRYLKKSLTQEHSLSDLFNDVLDVQKFEKFLIHFFPQTDSTLPTTKDQKQLPQNPKPIIKLDQIHAQSQLQSINTKLSRSVLLPVFWYLSNTLRTITEGLFVDQVGMKRIKDLMNNNERVVLLPTYKSYADVFVLLFALASADIPLPFTVGNREDIPRVRFIEKILHGIGYIMTSRSKDQSF